MERKREMHVRHRHLQIRHQTGSAAGILEEAHTSRRAEIQQPRYAEVGPHVSLYGAGTGSWRHPDDRIRRHGGLWGAHRLRERKSRVAQVVRTDAGFARDADIGGIVDRAAAL